MDVKFVMFKDGNRRDVNVPAGTNIVGRREDCAIRVPSDNVSRAHCQVTVTDDSVKIKDLGSSNGTYVNDRRITETGLKPGDQVRVGPITFTVQINGKPANIVSPDEIAALMGDDDSGEIDEVLGGADEADSETVLDSLDDLDFDEDEDEAPAPKKPAAGKGVDINELDALDALDLLDVDDDDDTPSKKK